LPTPFIKPSGRDVCGGRRLKKKPIGKRRNHEQNGLVSILREHFSRSDDTRTLIRQIFETEADLLPDPTNKTLTVRIHHLTQAAHDHVLEKLCAALNETQTVFPGTDLTLIFKIGSSQFPPGQEV